MRWSYKTVHYELKKEGLLGNSFLDESEVEQSLNEYGKAGWELISMLETLDGLIAVFKQPLSFDARSVFSRETAVERTGHGGTAAGDGEARQLEPKSGPRRTVAMDLSEELVLVDDYEIVEESRDRSEKADVKVSKPVVDVGTIRIE